MLLQRDRMFMKLKYLVALKLLVTEYLPEDFFGLVTCGIQAVRLFKCVFVTAKKKVTLPNSLYTTRHQTGKSSEGCHVTRSPDDRH